MPSWIFDGPRVSFFCEPRPQGGLTIVGAVILDGSDRDWLAFDSRSPDQFKLTAKPLGSRPTRDEAKTLVELAFEPPTPDAPNP